jgi:hypothetical protein
MKKITNKEEILSMHRALMTEQAAPSSDDPNLTKLRDSVKSGCLKNGKIFLNRTKNTYFYKATTKSGKEVNFFPDMTYSFADGTKNGTWKCPEIVTPTPSVDDKFKKAEVESYKTKYGAKTKEEAIRSGWDLTNLKKITVDGVDLYFPASNQDVITGVSQEQKDALVSMKEKYNAKEWKDLTGDEKVSWEELPISNSERLFGKQVKLYYNKLGQMQNSSDRYTEISKTYDLDEKTCEELILRYFDDYKTGRPMPPDYFKNEKSKVQFCKNKYHNNWGIKLNSGKLNKILGLMSREISTYDGARVPPSIAQPGSDKHLWTLSK